MIILDKCKNIVLELPLRELFISKNGQLMVWCFIAFYQILFIWHGLDITDTGFWFTSYTSIFNDPESVASLMYMWLTLCIGGLIELTFGTFGIIGHRVAYIILVYLTIFFSYKAITLEWPRAHPIIFVPVIFTINLIGTNYVHYYSISMLFYTCAAYLLLLGIYKNNRLSIFGSGFILSLNMFVKPPNILGIILLGGLIIVLSIKYKDIAPIKNVAYGVIGSVCGVLFVILMMLFVGHLDIYSHSLRQLLTVTSDGGTHDIRNLIHLYLRGGVRIASYAALLFVVFYLKIDTYTRFLWLKIFALMVIMCWLITHLASIHRFIYALCLVCIVAYFIHGTKERRLSILLIVSSIILIITPIGSNTGLWKAIYAFVLILPIVINLIYTRPELFHKGFRVCVVITLILCCCKGMKINRTPFRDDTVTNNYFKSEMDIDRAKFVYSSQERVELLQELIERLLIMTKKGDRILAYEKIAMVYYLTKTHPWLSNPWPMILSIDEICNQICNYAGGQLPIVARAKFSTSDARWPLVKSPLLVKYALKRTLINKFISMYNYRVVWSNQFFEILNTDDTVKGDLCKNEDIFRL